MTDVLDRIALEELEPISPPTAPAAQRPEVRSGLLAVAATLSVAAGVIHLVMVPSHSGESLAEGIGFALAGWFQLVSAAVLFTRRDRALVIPIGVANALFIGAWVWSRTLGIPLGEHAGHPESAGFVDMTTVAFEAALVLTCIILAVRPAGERTRGGGLTAVLVMGIAALATAAIASPSARDHAAHSHGDAAAATATAGHDHAATDAVDTVDDKGLSALSNGHHHEIGPEQPLDQATRAELSRQIAITQQAATQYPNVAAVEAAGYRRAGPFSPGLGAHYIKTSDEGLNFDGVMDDADLLNPLSIIYASTAPDAPVAGFMYYSMSASEPAGFAGPNDHWHYHTNTCIKPTANGEIDAPFGADTDVPADLCTQAGGHVIEQTQWMVHVWSVPGWESQQGLFGEVNPALSCADGSYHMLPMEQWLDHPLNVCPSG